MTDLIDVVQLQEIPSGIVDLFEVTINPFSVSPVTVYLYRGLDETGASVWFPNKTGTAKNEYFAFPIEMTDVSITSDGPAARPTLSVANVISAAKVLAGNTETVGPDEKTLETILSDLGITSNEDLLGARVTRRRTLEQHLLSAGANPVLPIEFPSYVYYIDRLAGETKISVSFELSSPFDLEGVKIPHREIIGRYCSWKYQGMAENNEGGCSWPLDSNNRFYKLDNTQITVFTNWSSVSTYAINAYVKYNNKIYQAVQSVPVNKVPSSSPAYWTRVDLCGKTIDSCKARFQNGGVDGSVALPFGGFPGTRKFK